MLVTELASGLRQLTHLQACILAVDCNVFALVGEVNRGLNAWVGMAFDKSIEVPHIESLACKVAARHVLEFALKFVSQALGTLWHKVQL